MKLKLWADKHGVSPAALAELAATLGTHPDNDRDEGRSEAAAQKLVQLEASRAGARLWRNNVGALLDKRGVPVRYGLANETPAMNKVLKSSDLIGIRPVLIESRHVGLLFGQFVAREMKAPGWKYAGTDREVAQLAYLNFVLAKGGDAQFCTGEGTL